MPAVSMMLALAGRVAVLPERRAVVVCKNDDQILQNLTVVEMASKQ
jgi:hypothetical protein